MKRALNFTLGSAVVLVLLAALGVQFISSAPAREQSATPSVPRGLGRTLVITSTADSGPGTLRQALLGAQSGDTITFDPAIFPPTSPVTISLTSGLPGIGQGNLTVDASNAGVILDGGNIGTTPETLLLDDISLTLDGGPNLIVNGDFTVGLGHWRPWDEVPGATRGLNSSDFHSSPNSYAWSSVAQAGEGRTVYDTADTSAAFDSWCHYSPYDNPASTVWISVTGGATAHLRFWYRHGPVTARLHVLFADHHSQIAEWRFDRQADWTEAVASQPLPADAVHVGLDFGYSHSEYWTVGLSVTSNGNTIRGLQIVHFPGAGMDLGGGVRNNVIGGDRGMGTGPLGQGNLISSNGNRGIVLSDASFNTIVGNYLGTDLSGAVAWGNRWEGIHMSKASHNQVIGNVISSNSAYGGGGGIDLGCCDASNNTISGNYIGTDASGAAVLGNHGHGIAIHDGPSDNTIGPGNVIAYNDGDGIWVCTAASLHNTITQNSIHDNGGRGIALLEGGNAELAAPLILDFDLNAGTVTGWACANCAVEVFSDSSDEGEVYEGRTTADSFGVFTFDKGTSLAGPHLTVTTTDPNGNTSQFSASTSGLSGTLSPQEGNHLPYTRLRTKEPKELEDNRIGTHFCDLWHPASYQEVFPGLVLDVSTICELGLKRIRLTINNLDSHRVDWTKPEFFIDPSHDAFIGDLAANGITVTYVLSFWDTANHPEGWEEISSRFKTEEEIQRYLEFVHFIVHHFKDRIQYFEIWNEPDNDPFPVQYIEVADYINLVKRAVPVIRQEYPEAKIVVGSTAYLRIPQSYNYLFSILRSEIMPLVDVVAWHPMYGTSPEYDFHRQYYYEYPSIVQEIKDVASAHGFGGEYEADELTWRTPERAVSNLPWPHTYSETKCAKYLARGIVMHLGMDVAVSQHGHYPDQAQLFRTIQNLCTIMAGARPITLPIQIQSEAGDLTSYSFSLSDGSRLIALWTDGVAVDDDPGVKATLTIPGFADQTAIGIDVLHGFEQRMITDTEGENLVVRNLMVKDYPINLRIAPTRYVFLPVVVKGYAR